MNRNIASALVIAAAAVAGNAFADDITLDNTPFVGSKTRAEVQAELAQFKRAGTSPWSTQYNQLAKFQSTKSRAEVVAEFTAARDEVAALNSEDSGSAYLAQHNGRQASPSTTLAGQPRNAQ
jgi:vacuolar-type H+-ATPase catalytic subunit A/Vma1